jgi:hypothetical protein
MERTALAQDTLKSRVSVTKIQYIQSKFHLRKHCVRCGSETVQKLLKAKELMDLTVVLDTKHPSSDEVEFANSAAALPAQK